MNEQIKKLKHLASVWCDENIPEQWSDEINGYGKGWEDKFAELIVRECVEICKKQEYKYWRSSEEDQWTPIDSANAIREHFGVSE